MKRLYYLIAACLLIVTGAGCRKQGDILPKEAYAVYAPFAKGDTILYTNNEDSTTIPLAVTNRHLYENIVHGYCFCLSESGMEINMETEELSTDEQLEISCRIYGYSNGTVIHELLVESKQGKYNFGQVKSEKYVLQEEAVITKHRLDDDTSIEEVGVFRKGHGLVRFTDPDGRTWRLVGYEEDGLN